ncbi:hypothetical protein ACFWFI_25135 [Streptomyces sp. NPDC060209]|uniref:hypothetical protein n=1 Tax=Streptomyces sp. NPDC060209 TaxID=3347073 RepID=UPI003658A001
MRLYLAIPVVLLALLIAASGVAAIAKGWVMPTYRRPVRRLRLFGWGQLVVALALCMQAFFLLAFSATAARQWGSMTASLLLPAGLVVMAISQRAGGNQRVSAKR